MAVHTLSREANLQVATEAETACFSWLAYFAFPSSQDYLARSAPPIVCWAFPLSVINQENAPQPCILCLLDRKTPLLRSPLLWRLHFVQLWQKLTRTSSFYLFCNLSYSIGLCWPETYYMSYAGLKLAATSLPLPLTCTTGPSLSKVWVTKMESLLPKWLSSLGSTCRVLLFFSSCLCSQGVSLAPPLGPPSRHDGFGSSTYQGLFVFSLAPAIHLPPASVRVLP